MIEISVKNIKDIGALVKKVRLVKKLSQDRAASLAGVGRRFLSELEAGKKDSLEVGLVLQVLSRLGIKLKIEVKLNVET